MRIDISLLPALAAAFMLAFARIGAMVMLMPGLGEANIPVRIKLSIALLLTLIMLPLHRQAYHVDMQSLTGLLVMMLQEIFIGIVLGATARVTLGALQVAGSVIAQQMGLGFVTSVDPTQGQQGLLVGNFLTMLGVTLLFATDSHHLVIAALNDSYAIFSPGETMASGDVVKSQELNTWFVIAAGTLVMSTFSESIGGGLLVPLRNLIANAWMIRTDGPGLLALAQSLEYAVVAAIGVPLLMLALAAIAGNMMQHRLVWSGEQLKPKFSKISPGAGFKRIFGKQAAANFGKGLFKLTALGAVMTAILWPERHRLEALVRYDPAALLGVTSSLTIHLLGAVVAMLAVVAIGDYLFQYRPWFEKQKMSLQGMQAEFKQCA